MQSMFLALYICFVGKIHWELTEIDLSMATLVSRVVS